MTAIDYREFVRFVVTGGVATIGNLGAVWVARGLVSFKLALLFGIAAGMTLSFVLTKLFAFRSRAWSTAGGEAYRFLIVYGVGLVIYWTAALALRTMLERGGVAPAAAEMLGVLSGAVLMAVTGYFGHRFFTYRVDRPAGAR